jgi:hypothetical protein
MKIGKLGENLIQRHFVHHKTHMTIPGFEPWAVAVRIQRLFFFKLCGGTLDTANTYWPIVPAPDDR